MHMRIDNSKKTIVKAAINNRIVLVDLASDNRDAYQDLAERIKYLGSGIYYSYTSDGIESFDSDPRLMHFWSWKSTKK